MANSCLPNADWILCSLLLLIRWVVILRIAPTYFAEMVFHAILVNQGWFHYCCCEFGSFYGHHGSKSQTPWLRIKPGLVWDKVTVILNSFSLHFLIEVWKWSRSFRLRSDVEVIFSFLLNSSITLDVWVSTDRSNKMRTLVASTCQILFVFLLSRQRKHNLWLIGVKKFKWNGYVICVGSPFKKKISLLLVVRWQFRWFMRLLNQ